MFHEKRKDILLYAVTLAIIFIWLPLFSRIFKFIAAGYWRVLNIFQYQSGSLMISNELGMSRGMLTICLVSLFTFPLLWKILKNGSADDDGNTLLTLFFAFICSLGAIYFFIVSSFCYNVFMTDGIACHEYGKVKLYSWEDVSSVRLNCEVGHGRFDTQSNVAYELLMKDGRHINMYYAINFEEKIMMIEPTYLLDKKHITEAVDYSELDIYFSYKTILLINEIF